MAKEKDSKVKKDNKYFMKDVKAELKRVTWPTSKEMVNNVTAVIAIVIITAAIVFVLDLFFGAVNKYGLGKLKEQLKSNQQTQTQIVSEEENNSQQQSQEQQGDTQQSEENGNQDTQSTETNENGENAGNDENPDVD